MFASVARFPLGLWDISGNALIGESLGSMAEKAYSSTFHMKFQVRYFCLHPRWRADPSSPTSFHFPHDGIPEDRKVD